MIADSFFFVRKCLVCAYCCDTNSTHINNLRIYKKHAVQCTCMNASIPKIQYTILFSEIRQFILPLLYTLPFGYRKSNVNFPEKEVRYPNYSDIPILFLERKSNRKWPILLLQCSLLRDFWIRTQSAAAACGRAINLATHPFMLHHPSLYSLVT